MKQLAPTATLAAERRPLRSEQWLIAGTAAVLSLLIAGLGCLGVAPFPALEDWLLDRALIQAMPNAGSRGVQRTVVIDIDELSLAAVGQWPWPRYRVAALIDRVAAAKPAAIGLDILFPEADRTSLANIRQTFKNDFGVEMQFSGVPAGLLDNDGFLAEVMARTGVVGAHYYHFDHVTREADGRPTPAAAIGPRIEGGDLLPDLPVASGLMLNAAVIAAQTRSSGFVNNRLDRDGQLRRLPMLIRHGESVAPSLSLATVMRATGASTARIEVDAQSRWIGFGAYRVPVDARGYATLRFEGGAEALASISALDVLNGRFDPADLRGRIVFIGSTAVGGNDIHATAVDARFPGLKIQSVAAENLLGGRFVEQPRWAGAVAVAACLLVGAVVAAGFIFGLGVAGLSAGTAGLALALVWSGYGLFATTGMWLPLGTPLVLLPCLVAVCFAIRSTTERRRAARFLKHLENARQVTMESMAAVAETRDPETGAHIKRTQHYVRAVALELRRSGHHPQTLSTDYIELLFLSAPLHDIGKVGIPDHILLKPGKLTDDEMVLMKTHAGLGGRIVSSTAGHIAGDNFLVVAGEIASTHHEKWDGSGYPLGLRGEAIPLAGRIMAVADVYDALISRRCYKEPFPHLVALPMMRAMRGTTFDPMVLDAFMRIEPEILAIAARYRDESESSPRREDSGHRVAVQESGLAPLAAVDHLAQVFGSVPRVDMAKRQRREAETQDVDGAD